MGCYMGLGVLQGPNGVLYGPRGVTGAFLGVGVTGAYWSLIGVTGMDLF